MRPTNKKIGEILIENNFITPQILNEALEYQKKFGIGVTQYLIAYGYIDEEELAKCISTQFGFPYLPLRVYNIPDAIIDLVPVRIVEKYWLIPIDKVGDILTVVMANPIDPEAIREVGKASGCNVQPFVGILSDIIKAIEHYYHIIVEDDKLKKHKIVPLFIDTRVYKGIERRKSVRLNAKLDIRFPVQDLYKKSKTKNVSLNGFLFESENILPIGSYVTFEINLPKEFCPTPLAAVAQIARVIPLQNKKFDIGARLIKMPKEDITTLIQYCRAHEE